jgi:hypothetical protein
VRSRKAEIVRRVHALPTVSYDEGKRLTSFSGLVLFFALFRAIDLSGRLRRCFAHLGNGRVFGSARVVLQLVVHVILGFRRLRDRDYYADDPLVCRLLGVKRLPDVATISRTLSSADGRAVENVRGLVRDLVVERLAETKLSRITLDFDGSVLSTARRAEGSAVGYNPRRKGARSYYPLFGLISQLGMFLDLLHRPGNVHDSCGAIGFIDDCVSAVRKEMPGSALEARLDSAFFDEGVLELLEERRVEYAAAVPFSRFVPLRHLVDSRERWTPIDDEWSYFETSWKPKKWVSSRRIILVRRRSPVRRKGPLQLDLFEPVDHNFDYKAIVTNKQVGAATVLSFFNGRGIQEQLFGEAKQHASLDYVPSRRLVANQLYVLSTMLAHNLSRELQFRAEPERRPTTPTRAGIFIVRTLGTLRDQLIRRAGAITRPQGRLTLTVAAPKVARDEFDELLRHLHAA